MTQLTWLQVYNTNITDDGLKCLAPLSQLEALQLRCTNISDAGLPHLEKLSALKNISLANTNVTAEGIRRLRAALPNCQVSPGADELSRQPIDLASWTDDGPLTREQLLEVINGIGGKVQVDESRIHSQITELMLWGSDISDEVSCTCCGKCRILSS